MTVEKVLRDYFHIRHQGRTTTVAVVVDHIELLLFLFLPKQ